MIPTWLDDVLSQLSTKLGLALNASDRELAAELVLEALPKDVTTAAIRASTRTVLKSRGIADASDDLAREISRNAAQSVVTHLHVGEHEEAAVIAAERARAATRKVG